MNWIDEKVNEYDNSDFFDGNIIHGRTGFIPGCQTIAHVRDFIRTALADSYEKGYNDAYEKLQNLQQEKQGDAS